MLHQGKFIFDGTSQEIQKSDNPIIRHFVRGEAGAEELAELRNLED